MRRRRCSDGRDRGRFRADAAFCVGHRVIIYRLATGGPFPDRVRPYILGQFILVAARTPLFFLLFCSFYPVRFLSLSLMLVLIGRRLRSRLCYTTEPCRGPPLPRRETATANAIN